MTIKSFLAYLLSTVAAMLIVGGILNQLLPAVPRKTPPAVTTPRPQTVTGLVAAIKVKLLSRSTTKNPWFYDTRLLSVGNGSVEITDKYVIVKIGDDRIIGDESGIPVELENSSRCLNPEDVRSYKLTLTRLYQKLYE